MARDVSDTSKNLSASTSNSVGAKNNNNGNNQNNKSPPSLDQKVPPLRIVLNTAGTQKTNNNQDSKNSDSQLKVTNKVRIKLGNAQESIITTSTTSTTTTTSATAAKEDKEPVIYSHLRRITRRSQRTNQLVTNEDEESMTSLDENLTNTNSNPNTNDNEVSPPRRYKRRKCETSETQSTSNDYDTYDYKPPNQNSFELYKNIRKQVDDKLRNLNTIQPRTPFGLKDYLTTRGAYLLDGNKLGNGTNLYHGFQNEGKSVYDIPDRAKVPLGLAVSSPLYNLFIDQEKERYKMRMQHLKEREKLTLATEQEIMRVYSKAALVAANQDEPLSACNMLKHQEIYNSFEDVNIQSNNDADSEPERSRRERVRTRRRNAEAAFAAAAAAESLSNPNNNNDESPSCKDDQNSVQLENDQNDQMSTNEALAPTSEKLKHAQQSDDKTHAKQHSDTSDRAGPLSQSDSVAESEPPDSDAMDSDNRLIIDDNKDDFEDAEESNDSKLDRDAPTNQLTVDSKMTDAEKKPGDTTDQDIRPKVEQTNNSNITQSNSQTEIDKLVQSELAESNNSVDTNTSNSKDNIATTVDKIDELSNVPMDLDAPASDQSNNDAQQNNVVEDLDQKQNRELELFINQLHDIDDKWERVRNEMLIRHKNEAESLHAVQRLEWEWKTKEIGACDIRSNPPIDKTLVPKLEINTQDY